LIGENIKFRTKQHSVKQRKNGVTKTAKNKTSIFYRKISIRVFNNWSILTKSCITHNIFETRTNLSKPNTLIAETQAFCKLTNMGASSFFSSAPRHPYVCVFIRDAIEASRRRSYFHTARENLIVCGLVRALSHTHMQAGADR
jgi:hypothetical protein